MPNYETWTTKRQLYSASDLAEGIARMGRQMSQWKDSNLALIGIRRGGENLVYRLKEAMGVDVPVGMVDISLYRDDGFGPHEWPTVGSTAIDFELRKHTVVLVDDVLFTGRTVRAAIDALVDYGRAKAIRLAVLVDRGCRELPIRGDVVGWTSQTVPQQHIDVVVSNPGSENDGVWLYAMDTADKQPSQS